MSDAVLIPVVTWGLALWLALYVAEYTWKAARRFGWTATLAIGTGCIITIGMSAIICWHAWSYGSTSREADRPPTQARSETHLPTKCRPLYNDGTDAWIECMGVGKR